MGGASDGTFTVNLSSTTVVTGGSITLDIEANQDDGGICFLIHLDDGGAGAFSENDFIMCDFSGAIDPALGPSAKTITYTPPEEEGIITFTCTATQLEDETESDQNFSPSNSLLVGPPIAADVRTESNVETGDNLVISFTIPEGDFGGNTWTVFPSDNGAGGAFTPSTFCLSDATGSGCSNKYGATITYRAPSSPKDVHFNFTQSVQGSSVLVFSILPSITRVVSIKHTAFLDFFE